MSRRTIVFALAASATLIATQASADRECFENSCEQTAPGAPAPLVPGRMVEARAARPERIVRRSPAIRTVVVGVPVVAPAILTDRGAAYAEDDVVRVYPNPRHDPAWKLCQLDARESDQRRCGAYSYHPYGVNGYRPYGVYAAGRSAVYTLAPNAKIIAVDRGD